MYIIQFRINSTKFHFWIRAFSQERAVERYGSGAQNGICSGKTVLKYSKRASGFAGRPLYDLYYSSSCSSSGLPGKYTGTPAAAKLPANSTPGA